MLVPNGGNWLSAKRNDDKRNKVIIKYFEQWNGQQNKLMNT
jgi:hypothetical protein